MNQLQRKLQKKISRFDGKTFRREIDTNYKHSNTRSLGSYRGAPFITGGWSPDSNKTEIYAINSNQWIENTDYPFNLQ